MPQSTLRSGTRRRRTVALGASLLLAAGLALAVPVLKGDSGPSRGTGGVAASTPPPVASTESPRGARGPCAFRPNRSNTGARGVLEDRGVTKLTSGQSLEDARVGSLEVTGSNVTIRNVEVDGTILVTGDHVSISSTTAQGIYVSSGSHVTVERSRVEDSLSDAFHVTSDRRRLVRDVTLSHNFVHRPVTPSENHYDGVQVRGVDGMSISCSTFQAGRFHPNFNAAVFLEDANGGTSNVRVRNNWFFGFAFSVMVDSPTSSFVGNKIGGDIKWGPCLMFKSAGRTFTSRDNTWAGSGRKVSFCNQG